jgi:hypothetical protein
LIRALLPAILLRLADDPTGNARRGGSSSATGYCVNYDRGSSIAENGVIVGAESHVWRDYGNVRRTVSADDKRKIRDVARGGAFVTVLSAAWIEMGTCGLKIRRVTRGNLMNVDGVLSRWQIFDVERDFDTFRRAGKLRCPHALALGVLEFDDYWLGSGAAMRLLGLGGRSEGEKQTHPA